MCSDIEIQLLDLQARDPLRDYREGLGKLAELTGVRLVGPGHGQAGDAGEFCRRLAMDGRYLDALERGEPFDDPRLASGWLRAEHQRQVRYACS